MEKTELDKGVLWILWKTAKAIIKEDYYAARTEPKIFNQFDRIYLHSVYQ